MKKPKITAAMRQAVISEMMSERSRRRKPEQRKGGRPRSTAPRCPCGAMTVKKAALRCHHCHTPQEIAIMKTALPAVHAASRSKQDECWPGDPAAHDDYCQLTDHRLSAAAVKATEGLSWEFDSWSSTADWMHAAIAASGKDK